MPSSFSSPPMRWRRPGRAGHRPRARQVLVAHVGQEARRRLLGSVAKPGSMSGSARHVGQPPRLGGVGEERVGQQHHRRAVLDRDADGLDRGVEAPAGRGGGHHRQRRLAVAAVERHQQVALLGLGGHARSRGRRAGRPRSPSGSSIATASETVSAFRSIPGPLVAVTPSLPGEGGAQRHAGRGDLVLGLHRAHAEPLVAGEAVQQLGGGRDRIAGVEELQPALHAGGDQAREPAPPCR